MAIPRPPTEEEAAEAAANAEAGAETKVETEEAESEFDQDRLEDAYLAKTVAERALRGRYVWCFELGWMGYRGGVWRHVADDHVVERVRVDMIKQFEQEARDHALGGRLKELARLLATGKIRSVAGLCRGILEITADKFDAHPDLLNVGNGVIDLRNSTLLEHDPNLYLTKITKVPYRAAAKSDDWDTALEALPAGVRTWMQLRFGQAATGYPTSDDLLTVSQGSGANGKSTVFVGVQRALGEHATVIPEKAIIGNPNDHSTELMTLRGARFAMIEELPEGRHFNIKRLKDVVGTPTITGRLMRKNNTTFSTTHSLFITSNYRPRIDEVDHGSWRRLALVRFPTSTATARTALSRGSKGYGSASRKVAKASTKRLWPGSSTALDAGTPPAGSCHHLRRRWSRTPKNGGRLPT
jgi:putative DNA primase/helicase